MERIDNGSFFLPREKRTRKKSTRSEKSPFRSLFSKKVEEIDGPSSVSGPDQREPMSEEQLVSLLDAVHSTGDRLKRDFSLDALEQYKQAVRQFMSNIVGSNYEVSSELSSRNVLNRKQYVAVQVIDQKLDSLAASVLREQRNQLEILQRVEEINGFLVDLLR